MNPESSITFLGTGGDIGIVGKQLRSSGGIILNLEGNQFLLDPGPGCLNNAKKANANLRETIAIFTTNRDILLSNDVNIAIAAMTLNGTDRTGVFIGSKSVISGTDKDAPVLMPDYKAMVEKVLEVSANTKIGINDIDIHTIQSKSSDPNAFALKFVASNFSIGYTGCTELTKEIIDGMKGSEILIVNCKNPKGVSDAGQMNIEDVIALVNAVRPRLVVTTYFGKKMLELNPIAEIREIKSATGVQAVAASDGTVINTANYASGPAGWKRVPLKSPEKDSEPEKKQELGAEQELDSGMQSTLENYEEDTDKTSDRFTADEKNKDSNQG